MVIWIVFVTWVVLEGKYADKKTHIVKQVMVLNGLWACVVYPVLVRPENFKYEKNAQKSISSLRIIMWFSANIKAGSKQ